MMLGKVAFISSGEASATGAAIFRRMAGGLPKGFRVSVLETPAGFELNSAVVAKRIADSIALRLGEWSPRIDVIPARRKGDPFGTDSPGVLAPLPFADLIYMGAGSPTYTVRQLRHSLAWKELLAAWQLGAGLVMASAAAVAMGKFTLPVYEIFKAGEDPEWKPGLDLLGSLGWHLAVVSHWNNAEGGEGLDTSRCFIGRGRFDAMRSALPPGSTVLGLDEHTAAIFDWQTGKGLVEGKGTIVVWKDGRERVYPAGGEFPLRELGDYRIPDEPFGVGKAIWESVKARRGSVEPEPVPPPDAVALLSERDRARKSGEYAEADRLRIEIERLGWSVMDTPQGTALRPRTKG